MARPKWILWQSRTAIRPIRVTGRECTTYAPIERQLSAAEDAFTIAHALSEYGYRQDPVLMAIPGTACLPATVPFNRQIHGRDRQALLYAFEEHLPISLEDLAVDFLIGGGGKDSCLGIGVETHQYREVLEQLEEHGVAVHHLVPAALAATQYVVERTASGTDPGYVLWSHEEGFDLLRIHQGKPIYWRSFTDLVSLQGELRHDQLSEASHSLIVCGRNASSNLESAEPSPLVPLVTHQIATLCSELGIEVTENEISLQEAACQGCSLVLDAKQLPWIDLRRDSLRAATLSRQLEKGLRFFAVSGLILALALVTALELVGQRMRAESARLVDQQVLVFQQTMPGQRVPIGIRTMLEAELTKLSGAAGQMGKVPVMPSSLFALRDVLASFPSEVRVRLLEINIEGDQISVEGQARQHADAEQIATKLVNSGWKVPSPRTEALSEQGVSWSLTATSTDDVEANP